METARRRFEATLAAVPEATRFAVEAAGRLGLQGVQAARLELAVEEAVANVWRHAYAGASGPFWVEVRDSPGWLEVTVEDEGPPFDALTGPEPDLSASVEERSPGGLGLVLMRSMVERVTRERAGSRNRLTLAVRL